MKISSVIINCRDYHFTVFIKKTNFIRFFVPKFYFTFRFFSVFSIKNIDTIFSYFISNNKEVVLKFVSGSTVYHLYGKELSNLNFHFHKSLTEQTRIATILSDMDAELEALEQQLHKARQIKQGMMQELLTGRVRLV